MATELESTISINQGYYRFSVESGLGSIPAPPQILSQMISITNRFLCEERVQSRVHDCLQTGRLAGQLIAREMAQLKAKPRGNNHSLPALSAFFVARLQTKERLNKWLLGGSVLGPCIVVVSGMAGVGKAQLLLHFAHQNANWFKHGFYIDGSSIQTVAGNLVARVRELGHTCRTIYDALKILDKWDEQTDGKYLIIFDNVDDRSVAIANYFPQSTHAFILISTRNRALGDLAPEAHLELGEMTPKEAVKALLKVILPPGQSATNEQTNITFSIAEELGYLPVALIQAGGYIKPHHCLGDYLSRLRKSPRRILIHPLPEQRDKYQTTLYTSLDLMSERLSPLAQQYLHIFSFGHYRNFPPALIELAAEHHFLLDPVTVLDRGDEFRRTTILLHGMLCRTGEWAEDDSTKFWSSFRPFSL